MMEELTIELLEEKELIATLHIDLEKYKTQNEIFIEVVAESVFHFSSFKFLFPWLSVTLVEEFSFHYFIW